MSSECAVNKSLGNALTVVRWQGGFTTSKCDIEGNCNKTCCLTSVPVLEALVTTSFTLTNSE